jgi:hypothetical protein
VATKTEMLVWDRKANPYQPHQFSVDDCRQQINACVIHCSETFNKNSKKLRDLSPRFWIALMDLEMCHDSPDEELLEVFSKAYRYLGAPGDFGYGTPCGDALRNLYEWWNAWLTARKPADEVLSE